jgi:hypothetical protein
MNAVESSVEAGGRRERRVKTGWKTINGHRYYYKSERERGRVKSTYFGAGASGTLMANVVAFERLERAAEREQLREERRESEAEETAVRSGPGRGRRGDD